MDRYVTYLKAVRAGRIDQYTSVPGWIVDDLILYLEDGVPPSSGFLLAVLKNDLMGVSANADDFSWNNLRPILGLIYNHLPGNCWGSREKIKTYSAERVAGATQALESV